MKQKRTQFNNDLVVPITLIDGAKQGKSMTDSRKAMVRVSPFGISIAVEGFGDAGSENGFGEPIFIEFYEGRLVVRLWSDIEQSDPTHVIDMQDALETNRPKEIIA